VTLTVVIFVIIWHRRIGERRRPVISRAERTANYAILLAFATFACGRS